MADRPPPQYFPNELQPTKIDFATLTSVLTELRAAVRRGIDLIRTTYQAPAIDDNEAFGTIFNGSLGIALMALRLQRQASYLRDGGSLIDPGTYLTSFRVLMGEHINSHLMKLNLQPGRPSPLCSPSLGATVIRLLAQSTPSFPDGLLSPNIKEDIAVLYEAVQIAIHQGPSVIRHGHCMGGDEVLYGRAGLLWALLNIRKHRFDQETQEALDPVINDVSKLVDAIVDAGKHGAQEYMREHGKTGALPLMWPWVDNYYGLGIESMHGITGILTILLACRNEELDQSLSRNYLPLIAQTITTISNICISHNGHLPMSVPPWPSSRPSPLVQVCHGTPGLLLLLAATKAHDYLNAYRQPEWDIAIRLGSEMVWEQGLLSKGGGLCHGIAGNAWPWLIMCEESASMAPHHKESVKASPAEKSNAADLEKITGDYFLSRALAFLLHAQETQPFSPHSPYHMPENPFSLFEGIAGTICAWAEACVVITARLTIMNGEEQITPRNPYADENYTRSLNDVLGFPGLGGLGAIGLL